MTAKISFVMASNRGLPFSFEISSESSSMRSIHRPSIWSYRAGPVSWAGSRRRRAPGIRFEDLPRVVGREELFKFCQGLLAVGGVEE